MTDVTTASSETTTDFVTRVTTAGSSLPGEVNFENYVTATELKIVGWVLWVVIGVTLFGNLCCVYAYCDRRNFKVRENI